MAFTILSLSFKKVFKSSLERLDVTLQSYLLFNEIKEMV
jgi:hypothetical protein